MQEGLRSPSGRFEITLASWDVRMSLWIDPPTLTDTTTGAVLLSFDDAHWSLNSATWHSDTTVELRLRKYPGSHAPPEVAATLDCVAHTARIDGAIVPLTEVEPALERLLAWPQPPPPPRGFGGLMQRLYRWWRGRS